jgi:hypothetical protein
MNGEETLVAARQTPRASGGFDQDIVDDGLIEKN